MSRAYLKEVYGIRGGKAASAVYVAFEATITCNYMPIELTVTEEGNMFRNAEVARLFAEKIKDGLECKKVISATVIHKDNNGKTEQIDDFIEVPDNQVQHRYVDTALKLKRSYPDTSIDVTIPVAIQVNVVNYAKDGD